MSLDTARDVFKLIMLNALIDKAVYTDFHNVIVFWGELGKGKTTCMLWALYRWVEDWKKVLSFILNPHTCMTCGHVWTSETDYVYEVPCPECSKKTLSKRIEDAAGAARDKTKLVRPFPFDTRTGLLASFPAGQEFEIWSTKGRAKVDQVYPYLNFSFTEFKTNLENAVETRVRLPILGWDDIAVYFHRSNIQYMHPDVKNFFSRYNFIRKYVANVIVTVPTPNFVPEQLMVFCTADVLMSDRGQADFDVKKEMRNFWGRAKTFTKSYDGRNVTWKKAPEEVFQAYEEIRHAHAVEAFEKPEEIFVTSMPAKGKEYDKTESLF